MAVFWDVGPCDLLEIDRLFRGAYCHHHQGRPCRPFISELVLRDWIELRNVFVRTAGRDQNQIHAQNEYTNIDLYR
jgi:hypothetical protein